MTGENVERGTKINKEVTPSENGKYLILDVFPGTAFVGAIEEAGKIADKNKKPVVLELNRRKIAVYPE